MQALGSVDRAGFSNGFIVDIEPSEPNLGGFVRTADGFRHPLLAFVLGREPGCRQTDSLRSLSFQRCRVPYWKLRFTPLQVKAKQS